MTLIVSNINMILISSGMALMLIAILIIPHVLILMMCVIEYSVAFGVM